MTTHQQLSAAAWDSPLSQYAACYWACSYWAGLAEIRGYRTSQVFYRRAERFHRKACRIYCDHHRTMTVDCVAYYQERQRLFTRHNVPRATIKWYISQWRNARFNTPLPLP